MRAAIVLLAIAGSFASLPVHAQKKPNMDGEKVLADFAQCAVRAAPRESANLLDTVPDSPAEQAQIDLLFRQHGSCFRFGPTPGTYALSAQVALGQISAAQAVGQAASQPQQMAFPRRAMRGAIATRLYLDLEKRPFAGPQPVPTAAAGLPAGYVVVRCAAAQDPMSADRLVRAKRLSSAESDAGRALAPALNSCARGMGRIDMTGTAIHGWAAEALYLQRRPAATGGR